MVEIWCFGKLKIRYVTLRLVCHADVYGLYIVIYWFYTSTKGEFKNVPQVYIEICCLYTTAI